jgi:N-acetylmuramoyl-L-alanine amidase
MVREYRDRSLNGAITQVKVANMRNWATLGTAVLILAGCGRLPVSTIPAPDAPVAEGAAPPLPAITPVDGALAPRVTYPAANQLIAVDSNFIFGTVGSGQASLTINGAPVEVHPNGAWLAYLPVPRGESPAYELVATRGAETARLTHAIRRPAPRTELATSGRLVVDSASVTPRGTLMLRPDERVRVAVRAPSNASVWVRWDDGLQTMSQTADANTWAYDLPASYLARNAALFVVRGADTARFQLARVTLTDAESPRIVQLGDLAPGDTDRVIIGRPTPAGTYKWMLLPGTVVEQTGRQGEFARVRFDSQLEVWIDSVNVLAPLAGAAVSRRVVGNLTLNPAAEWVDVVLPMSSPVPFLVEQGEHDISLTLYNATASPDLIRFLGNDTLIRTINWIPEATDRVRLQMRLSQAPFGYLVMWQSGRMVMRVRRQPAVNASRPLQGITIAVDAGHPPGGAIGPTGLTEAEAVLQVAQRLQRILEERGARVHMTRTTMEPLDLRLRSVMARRWNAHALVSVHLNAFGDGVNPFVNNGVSTLFFHPQSEPLSRFVQRGMMRQLPLRDLGIHYQNISIGRTTWMPSLITEGLFMMLPDQEHAMRTAAGQERYARGVADGLEAYFRSLAR